jgi:large-conductance mechanosensitive channel
MKELSVREFVIKYTVFTSIVVWVIGNFSKHFLKDFIDLLIEPFFSIDLNENGEPDLKEILKYNLTIGNIKFPIGKIGLILLKFIIQIVIIYYIVYFIINYTDLVNFKMKSI